MPGNVGAASPVGVLPLSLSTAFTESRERLQLENTYHDGGIQRRRLVSTSRKRFKLSKRLTPAQLALLKDFYDAHEGGLIAFYFYNPFDVADGQEIGSNFDDTGFNTQGQYVVVFHGDWQQASFPARSAVPNIELIELASGDPADDALTAVPPGDILGTVTGILLTVWASHTPNSQDGLTHGTPWESLNGGGFGLGSIVPAGPTRSSNSTAIDPITDLSALSIAVQLVYSGGTIHVGDPTVSPFFTTESWNIYDAYVDVTYSGGTTLRFRAASSVGDDAGFSSGRVEDAANANDADAATPTTFARVERWHFSNFSDPAILSLSDFVTLV